jgi:hypothetical protein
MKKKKLDNSESINFLKNLYAQKYLFLIILALFTLSSVFFTNNNQKIKEANTQVTINYPNMEMFMPIDAIPERLFSVSQYKDIAIKNYSYKKFNFDFSSALTSQNNLINYLNKQINADYLKIFNEYSINPKFYFIGENFEVIQHPRDLRNNFSFILSMNHPLNFNAEEFLKDYVYYYKEKILSQYTKNAEDIISNLVTSFSFYKDVQSHLNSPKIQDSNCLLEVEGCLENQKKIIEYFDRKDQIAETLRNNLLKGVKQFSNNFSYEPILEIKTENISNSNNLIKNLIISSLLSFVLFFTIILFKEFFRDLLKKS